MNSFNIMESAQAEGSFTQPKLSKKQEWYQKHKDDPVYMERMRESRRKYYEKNKKDQSDKALDRYYAKLSEKLLNA